MTRWGIIGCGDVTEVKSGPGFQQATGSALVAVMRRDLSKAQDYARRHGVPRAYNSADALISDPEVDAVYIATPPSSHCELTLAVAAAGKPCLVEKPMARNHAECERMVAAFRASETSILGYHELAPFSQHYLLNGPAVGAHCARLMERFDVRPRVPGLRSSNFSGGNQQKLVLAREMARNPKVLLVGQPTRGVDIGAIEFIHRELVKSRDAGCAVLVVSVELDEILSLADRILVMFAGRIVGEVEGGRADERTLGLMMAGAKAA